MIPLPEGLCNRYGIGRPLGPLTVVKGGLLHRMYRLVTTEGVFAVKHLNPEVMKRPEAMANFRLAEQIARAVHQAGLPAVPARTVDREPVQRFDQDHYMVFEWMDGCMRPASAAKPEQARMIGSLLAQIHGLKLDLAATAEYGLLNIDWPSLLDRGKETGAPWARDSDSVSAALIEWTSCYNEAAQVLNMTQVCTHGDLGPKNVIWRDEHTPFLIDWEAAGWRNPVHELAVTALEWAGITEGSVDRELFAAAVRGYLDAGGKLHTDWQRAIDGGLGDQLAWLAFNMRRSFGEEVSEASERELGAREVLRTLKGLEVTARERTTWNQWVEAL